MRFKDKQTGIVYDTIVEARNAWCNCGGIEICKKCVIPNLHRPNLLPCGCENCIDFSDRNPKEAAKLMGLEIIENENAPVRADKPIGEYTFNEMYEYCKDRTKDFSRPVTYDECEGCKFNAVCCNLPEEWDLSNKKRLTDNELALCRMIGAKWVSRDSSNVLEDNVDFWSDRPTNDNGIFDGVEDVSLAAVKPTLMPSINPGDCICVEDLEQ